VRYSFKKARPKSLLKKDTKFWMAFLLSFTLILVGLEVALNMKMATLKESSLKTKSDREKLSLETEQKKAELASLKEHVSYVSKIDTSNGGIKDSMKNLFDIVPDKITLNKVELTPNCLALFGTTPSRDIFNLQFAPALKSVFTRSETSFVKTPNGNSRFISINKMEKITETQSEEPPKPPAPTHQTPEASKHDAKKDAKTDKGHH
jgi:hypothetical protein